MLILASKSPRRQELLHRAGFSFEIMPSDFDEVIPSGVSPEEAAILIANGKAKEIAKRYPNDVVIGADTIVVKEGEIFGKPRNEADAFRMLRALSGSCHQVITGVSIITHDEKITFAETTNVWFRSLSDEDISDYINTGEPFDKAGAYGIQELGGALVKQVEGDFDNVVGLPINRVLVLLNKYLRS